MPYYWNKAGFECPTLLTRSLLVCPIDRAFWDCILANVVFYASSFFRCCRLRGTRARAQQSPYESRRSTMQFCNHCHPSGQISRITVRTSVVTVESAINTQTSGPMDTMKSMKFHIIQFSRLLSPTFVTLISTRHNVCHYNVRKQMMRQMVQMKAASRIGASSSVHVPFF
jgi:hypothetical protein